jgi:outer membrane biosynthesis protein TonB
MHYRFYAAGMGRFMKPDSQFGSSHNPQGFNLYNYVQGNPVNFNDPTGHDGPSPPQVLSGGEGEKTAPPPPTPPPPPPPPPPEPKPVLSAGTKAGIGVTLTGVATDVAKKVSETPAMPKASEKLASNILVDTPGKLLPAAAKGATTAGVVLDIASIKDNVFTPQGAGAGMTPAETRDTCIDLGVNLAGLTASVLLEPETGGLSSIPLYLTAAAAGTDAGKLINAYVNLGGSSGPTPDADHVHWPGPY